MRWAGLCITMAAGSVRGQTITPIGHLPGGAQSWAFALSSDGSTAAGVSDSSNGSRAIRWSAAGGLQDLGTMSGGTVSTGQGVSGNGLVVVGYGTATSGADRAFRWAAPVGPMLNLGVLSAASDVVAAQGASTDGSVVVGYVTLDTGINRAFRWTSAGGMVDIGTLAGHTQAVAMAVNADGSVIAGYCLRPGHSTAFRWTATGGMVALNPPPSGSSTQASAISPDGAFVVGSSAGSGPVRWDSAGAMMVLSNPGAVPASTALGVSGDGSVIVGTGTGFTAWMWTAASGIVDLQAYFPAQGINLTGWTLREATGVSADGRTIAGYGLRPTGLEGFVAQLPSCLSLAGPADAGACATGAATFTVTPSGAGPFTFRWQVQTAPAGWQDLSASPLSLSCGGSALATTPGSALTDIAITPCAGVGTYQVRCVVSNACGSVTSHSATYSVCYANCDCSSAAPTLNVLDFACFLNRFAAGDPYANCDGSTASPLLNILDFACFLNQFAAGCS